MKEKETSLVSIDKDTVVGSGSLDFIKDNPELFDKNKQGDEWFDGRGNRYKGRYLNSKDAQKMMNTMMSDFMSQTVLALKKKAKGWGKDK